MHSSNYSSLSCDETLVSLAVEAKIGLTEDQVNKRFIRYGQNELPKPVSFSIWKIFFRQFSSPLIWFLFLGAIIAGFIREWIQMSTILAILVMNAIIGFFQEFSAEKSFQALNRMIFPKSTVLRNGEIKKILSSQIVPGDIVNLEAGDHVPADGRIIYAAQLAIQESALTGESGPIYKQVEPVDEKNIADQSNMAFMGTHVLKGKGKIVVTQTGSQTELGSIASKLQKEPKKLTPLQIRFNVLGKQMTVICLIFLSIIFILGIWKKLGWIELALTLLSLAIAAIPEGLPAIVTITLAIGVKRLFKKNVLIRKLVAVETLGCASVICADKTGTITKNEMVVLHYWIGGNLYQVTGSGYEPKGTFSLQNSPVDPKTDAELHMALKIGCLCNDAHLKRSSEICEILGDPTEVALLTAAAKAGMWKQELDEQNPLIGELPFDSERKRMTVLREDGHLYMKGTPESVISCCSRCIWNNSEVNLGPQKIKKIEEIHGQLMNQGYRVLALAHRKVSSSSSMSYELETNFCFVGLVAIIDPPRPEVKEAIQTCRDAKIIPIMITGDHKQTASTIAKEIGLMDAKYHMALDGSEIDKMSDKELQKAVLETSVFSRVSAAQKLRIVQSWKSHGHVVAMTGDGVNDTLAMKHADIGIAMGKTGTEITKQVAEMVILDDCFSTIVSAIKEGRGIYNNIVRFVRFLLSANFGELCVIIFGLLIQIPKHPSAIWLILLPSQILWINLVTDGFPAIALAFDPIEETTMKRPPRKISEPILSMKWIARLIVIGSFTALGAIVAAYLGFSTSKATGQTMAFTELVILELAILFILRLPLPLFSNRWLIIGTAISIVLQLFVIYGAPLHQSFGTTFLFTLQWLQIFVISIFAIFITFLALNLKKESL